MAAPPQKCASLRWVLLFFLCCTAGFNPSIAFAVRPFVTDDARIVYKGQLETESYAGLTLADRDKPTVEARALQGMSLTDRLEIIAGGFGFTYQADQARPLDMLVQPKYVLYRSFGAIPSISVAAASLFPLSGNRQQWNSYAMAHASWFLFTPEDSTDPYDNGLAVHINLGTKSQYDAGPVTYRSKLYWAAAFEVITPFSREIRFLGEVFNGDPFTYEEEFPAFQTGFRWYKTANTQVDLVFRGVRDGSEQTRLSSGAEVGPGWNYTIQVGFRTLFDVFR
ncbi:MAG TPA: hypothetical protein VFB56_04355 [Nitrospiraceae bacterium]|nr:hypothetical protein [Nitrospiraceae bacterium]